MHQNGIEVGAHASRRSRSRAVRRPGQRRRPVKNRIRGCGGLLRARPRAAAPTLGEMRADRMGMPRSPEHRAWLPRMPQAVPRAAPPTNIIDQSSIGSDQCFEAGIASADRGSCTTCRGRHGFERRPMARRPKPGLRRARGAPCRRSGDARAADVRCRAGAARKTGRSRHVSVTAGLHHVIA